MATGDARRIEMHLALRQAVGDNLADMLIEHLPPFEWTDIARQSDLLALRADVDMIKVDISAMKTDLHAMTTRLHNVTTDVHNLTTDVHNLTTDVHNLTTDVHNLTTDVQSMKMGIMRLDMRDQTTNARIDHLHNELVSFRDETNRRFDALEKRVNVVITAGVAFGLAMLALQVQIVLSLASI